MMMMAMVFPPCKTPIKEKSNLNLCFNLTIKEGDYSMWLVEWEKNGRSRELRCAGCCLVAGFWVSENWSEDNLLALEYG